MGNEQLPSAEITDPQEVTDKLSEFIIDCAATDTEIVGSDLERFAEMPNRRQALRAKDEENLTIFLRHAIARKLYRCPCCQGDIAIGSEHAIMSRIQMSKAYTHHHVDFGCVQGVVLPRLSAIEVIVPQQASTVAINKRERRYRNRRRRAK